jgi:hypothetical protein
MNQLAQLWGYNLEFAPHVGWPVWWILAAIGTALVLVLLYARMRGVAMRALSLGLLLAALTNPTLRQDERENLADIAAVIVDESTSQNSAKRLEQTREALAQVQQRLQSAGTEIRIQTVTSGTTLESDGTRMFAALDKAMADIPPERFAGAIFITDGQVHDVPKEQKLGGPLHVMLSGSKREIDRRVVIDLAPRFAIAGQSQNVTFHVEDDGSKAPVNVTVSFPDGTSSTLSVPPGEQQQLPFTLNRAGQNVLEIIAEPREGEISLANNRATALIKGIRDRLRVLLVSGQPHVGERTWRNLLKSDPSVDLVHFTILRPPEKQDGTPTKELSLIAFPTRELFIDKIKEFDLVIFDRYRREAILPDLYFANIAEYVRGGGSILVASGPDFAQPDGLASTPLVDVMPALPTGGITEQPFKPLVTDQGKRHPVTAGLPGDTGSEPKWGRWFRLIDATANDPKDVLMSGPDGKPLLVLQRVGEGRVSLFLSDHGWLWARGYEGGGPQMELLKRIAHWNMKEPDLEEEAITAKQVGQDIEITRRTQAETAEAITVTLPSGKAEAVTVTRVGPGIFTGRTKISEVGVHRFAGGGVEAAAAIGSAEAKEMSALKATAEVLQPIVSATGGGITWIEDGMPRLSKQKAGGVMAGSGFLALRDNQQFRVTAVREIPLFGTLMALAALLLVVSGMWFREGR